MTYRTIILRYRLDGYRETGQMLGKGGATLEEATQLAKDYNEGRCQEGMGPQNPKDGGLYAVAVPDEAPKSED